MKPIATVLLFLLLSLPVLGEYLGEMIIAEVPEGERINYIVRNPGNAILIVHSRIHPLSFESNMGIIRIDNPDPGEYRIYLNPSTTNIVTFKSEGYMPVKHMVWIERKDYKEVRVDVKKEIPYVLPIVIRIEPLDADILID